MNSSYDTSNQKLQLGMITLVIFGLGLTIGLGFFAPIIGCYALALVYIFKVSKPVDAFLGVLVCVIFSLLVTSRDEMNGWTTGGFGSDIYQYKLAFAKIIELKDFDLANIIFISTSNTGGSEPIFWSFIFFLSRVFSSPQQIWFALTLFSLLLLLYNLSKDSKFSPIPLLVVFCSTITFYIYQGSVIRQGLAFVLIYVAVAAYYKGRQKKAFTVLIVASLVHFSAFLILLCLLLGHRIKKIYIANISSIFGYILLFFLGLLALYIVLPALPSDINLIYKLQVRLNAASYHSSNWEVQFAVEVIAFLSITKLLKFHLPERIFIAYCALCFLTVAGMPFVGISDRLYRYTYVFYLFYYWLWMKDGIRINLAGKLGMQTILVLLSFGWFLFLFSTRYDGMFLDADVFGVLTTSFEGLTVTLK